MTNIEEWGGPVEFEKWWPVHSKSTWLEMRLHKHVHIHKDMWTIFGVRWSHVASCFTFFIVFSFFFGSYKQYGTILIPLGLTLCPYSNIIVSRASSNTFLLTTNFNTLPSTLSCSDTFLWLRATTFNIVKFQDYEKSSSYLGYTLN